MKITQFTSIQATCKKYRLFKDEEIKCLFHIYWPQKLHKNPTKGLFSSLKPFTKSVVTVFKHFSTRLKATMISDDIFQRSTLFGQF